MVNERYENPHEGQEESEYHFSDDQVNYEVEPESYKEGAPVAAPRPSIVDKLKDNRRAVMGAVVFLVLLVLVYKMLSPSTSTPPTDISQQSLPTAPVSVKPVVKVNVERPVIPAEPAAQQKPEQPAAPAVAQAPIETPVTTQQAPAAPAAPVPPAPIAAPMQQAVATPTASPPPAASAQQPAVIVNAAPAPVPAESAAQPTKPPFEAMPSPEQQNSALMNMMQSQYSQKIAEQESQVSEMKTQMQELNARVASMEVAFRQLTKILRNSRGQSSGEGIVSAGPNEANMSMNVSPPPITQPQRFNYTVQAIIPGRAWLKSDSGDTVTVAEGDILKDIGRVTKIDPYDGIVNIDTGRKIITLSYGVTGD